MSIVEVPVTSLSEVDDWIKKCAGAVFELPEEVFDHVVDDVPVYARYEERLDYIGRYLHRGSGLTCPVSHADSIYTRDWPFAHRWFIARDSAKAVYRFVLAYDKRSIPFMHLGV